MFEELDDQHQVEFLRDRPDAEVAAVLARMASDDAADLLLEIEQDRRIPVLNLLPASKQLKIKRLLGYNPSTAGGLMNPDFASLPADATVDEALEPRARERARPEPAAGALGDRRAGPPHRRRVRIRADPRRARDARSRA